jgi:menaquinone-dependent protoporphyrinogen oxidase
MPVLKLIQILMDNNSYDKFKVLVTYASRTGSTMGVAEAIGFTLSEHGFLAEIEPLDKVSDLTQYDAIICGSAIQDRQWLPEAMAFIQTHLSVINQKPFAIFSVCMTLSMTNAEKYRPGVMTWLDPVRSLTKPFSEGYFAGTLEFVKIPSFPDRFKFRVSVLLGVWKVGDHRDWDAIRVWTENLVPVLEDFNSRKIPGREQIPHNH